MQFLSLQPFVPSGSKFDLSKELFLALGFKLSWDAGDYVGFERDECRFILQKFDNKEFAENLMITVRVSNITEFYQDVIAQQLPEKFGIRISPPKEMPYGKESNVIDIAGVCWHFVE
ncbi:MAG: hypothetical protein ACXVBZ_06710 [Flavisolibacter sp.]